MQLIITDAWSMRGRTIYLSGRKLTLVVVVCVLLLGIAFTGVLILTTSKRAGESGYMGGQQARVVRENMEAMARQMGELSAKLAQVEALAERVSGLAGLSPAEVKAAGRGGPLVSLEPAEPSVLVRALAAMDQRTEQQQDLMTVLESRLLDERLRKMMLPTQLPVVDHAPGSPFGWRPDPFTGQFALHTGLDFPADHGTPVVSAAAGLVVTQEFHPAYGNLVEIDHGNEVLTRYAHLARFFVKKGDLVKRGQRIAEVGSTGRSTGPHLHFEVLVQGAYQNPEPFLKLGQRPVPDQFLSPPQVTRR